MTSENTAPEGAEPAQPQITFADLGLSEPTLRAVTESGYTIPTPIQEQAIPEVLKNRDVLGIAQTGTGKTAAFTLPMIDILAAGRARARMPRTLILEPTRELAAQVAEGFDKYGKYQKLTKALLIGGVSFGDQDALLARGVIGEGQHVDVSLQASMVSTIMTGASQWAMDHRDRNRTGASYPVGRTLQREVWRCRDGFVSYALRGGPARIPGLQATERWLAEERIDAPSWQGRDWKAYNHNDLTQEQVDALSEPLQELFLRKPLRELFDESVRRGVMLAPVNDSREIADSAQLRAREFFALVKDEKRGLEYELPARFAQMSRYGTDVRGPAPLRGEHNAEVYASVGVSPAELEELRRAGAV